MLDCWAMNRLRALFPLLALGLALGLPAARGENASAPLLPGDLLRGNILAPGDSDRLEIYLPSGTTFSVDVLAAPGSDILPGLAAFDPEFAPIDLSGVSVPGPKGVGVRVRNASGGGTGGTFAFLAGGTEGTSGKYSFRLTARMPRKTYGTLTVPAGEQGEFTFDAPAGSKMAFSVKPPAGVSPEPFSVSLRDPGDETTPLEGLSGKRIALGQNGTWALLVDNAGGTSETLSITVNLTLPKASKRVLYLSPAGFGPAPKVKSVAPNKVLDDRVAEGVAVTGEGFDPAAVVRLERKGQAPVAPSNLVIADAGHLTADFDVVGLDPGAWKVVVENPSGGAGAATLVVQAAGSVKLPAGMQPETEAWWIEFDRTEFTKDLKAIGVGSTNPDVMLLAEAAVKSYAMYWLRVAFRLDPATGKTIEGSVPVSFGLSAPPATVGAVGGTYNRLLVGGVAEGGDPSSNPNYAWGNGPYDASNAAFQDIGPAAGDGVRTGVLVPTLGGSVAGYYNPIKPLLDTPLTGADAKYFFTNFNPANEAEGTRYRDIAGAVNAAGKEIAGTIAHFVARAMGVADGASGLSSVPATIGEYCSLSPFSFDANERNTMTSFVRAGLPGRGKTLPANWFGLRETIGYLLPNATTTKAYVKAFSVAGGRPDLDPADLEFDGISGSIPPGYMLTGGGVLQGTAPLRLGNGTLAGGVYKFVARARDKKNGDFILFTHRLNLLVDVANAGLTPAEVAIGGQMNIATVNAP